MPVFLDGKLRYTLASGLPLTHFADVLRSLHIQPDYLVTVIDRNGRIVARSDRHDEFAGSPINATLPISTDQVERYVNLEGIPFHWFNRRSDVTGWHVSVGIPDAVFEAPSRRAGATFAIAGVLLLAAGIALSYRWGGRLARSAGALGIEREPTREEFEVLFEAAPNGVLVASSDGIIMLVNQLLVQKFGYRKDELIGQPIEVLVPDRHRAAHAKHRSDFARKPQARPMGIGRELNGKRKDGSEFPVEIALNPISTAGGLVMATIVDISAHKLSQSRLSAALQERDDLRRRYMQAQEGERLRLAHELHDQTGQTLTAALLELKGIEAFAAESARERLRSLRKQMEVMGETLHRVAWELRPLSIDEVGLASALGNYLSEWGFRYGIAADFYCREQAVDELSDEVRTTIYRVVQEGLTNIAKHAERATAVSVVIERTDAVLRLTINDNGCGFRPDVQNEPGSGLGIAGMRERLSLIGGEFELESAVGAGTTVFARIPVWEGSRAA
ncbi:MAG: PAS domain S-box protein [Xanthobacteraceae bacterium]|nr:PAS domain S-box protein [Xanthobacteraceae bacterium]